MGNKSYLISFIGMDGSGKTTTSKKLLKYLEEKGNKTTYIYLGRGRENILPIQKFNKKIKVESSIETDKKTSNKKKKISILHTLSAPVFALDLWLRYQFRVKKLKKEYKFILTDRYTTDILLMNKVPRSLKKILYIFFKKPEITFYLYNDVQTLHERKKHPLNDLKRQEKIFKDINNIVKPIKIKTQNEEETFNKIVKELNKIIENEKQNS